jgi:hypothetical protein
LEWSGFIPFRVLFWVWLFKLALIGFGNEGMAFPRPLDSKQGWLETHWLKVDIVAVSTAYTVYPDMLTTAGFQYVHLM